MVNAGVIRYQVDGVASNHVFYAGVHSAASNELMRLTGGGNLHSGTSATATAQLVVSGGVQNVASEASSIRATSSLNSTKIEIENTNVSGKLYEIRSVNNGNLDIVDRSTGAARVILDPLGNMGLAMTPTGGGNNGLFIGNGAGPTTIPAAGGALYVSAGRLFYRGSAGTVTLLAVA